jgi:sugar phosphate permease
VTYDPSQGAIRHLSFAEGVRILAGQWSFWVICVCVFLTLGVTFTNLSWLPGYLVKERGYTVMKSGLYLVIPYLVAFAGALLGGYLGDRTGHRGIIGFVASLLTGPAMLALMRSEDVNTTILWMGIALFLNAAAFTSLVILLFDLFPAEVVGVAAGVCIGLFGGLGGVIGPIVLGYSYDQTQSFFTGFCAIGLGATFSALMIIPIWFYEQRVKREKAERRGILMPAGLAEPVRIAER